MKDDVVEVVVDEDGNVIETEVIERVKPVLEVLEDDEVAEEDDDADDDDIEEEDDSEDGNDEDDSDE
jgi:DNA gyrase subunit A